MAPHLAEAPITGETRRSQHFLHEGRAPRSGLWRDKIQGVHSRLPGCGDDGPTLEIPQYTRQEERTAIAVNRPGLQHIAFSADDVHWGRPEVLAPDGGEQPQPVHAPRPPLLELVLGSDDPEDRARIASRLAALEPGPEGATELLSRAGSPQAGRRA